MTTTELTEKYISEHKSIKDCLKKGLINYSALSRLIAKELGIEKSTSREAILIAARRFKEKIKGTALEDKIIGLFKKSNIEIKNNIVIFTIEKDVYPDSLVEIEQKIKKEKGIFFSIEGTKTITVIVQDHYSSLFSKLKTKIMLKQDKLVLITVSSPGIESVPGAVNYLSGLFSEHEVNIEEFMSCHDDTLIVINSKDFQKVMEFLNF
ncbi:MAG: hypothetical protein KJ601_03020 [Nanoarchaeota archaeon]|nr:hypothetical protein [Nanoarchaeota archaeon]MBU1703758.1 hypothetical protein [Nanoarchaeota archaeon]